MRRHRRLRDRLSVDREATAAAGFAHPDSHIALDGRHIYYGQDAMNAYDRARLDWNGHCANCKRLVSFAEWHHKKSKGRHLRNDHPRNREWLCRSCHMKEHNRYPKFGQGDAHA